MVAITVVIVCAIVSIVNFVYWWIYSRVARYIYELKLRLDYCEAVLDEMWLRLPRDMALDVEREVEKRLKIPVGSAKE